MADDRTKMPPGIADRPRKQNVTRWYGQIKTIILYLAVVVIAAYAIKWLFSPHSFEACIQKHIGDAHTDRAVILVYRTCRDRHNISDNGL